MIYLIYPEVLMLCARAFQIFSEFLLAMNAPLALYCLQLVGYYLKLF